jgi:hypothetical protein
MEPFSREYTLNEVEAVSTAHSTVLSDIQVLCILHALNNVTVILRRSYERQTSSGIFLM